MKNIVAMICMILSFFYQTLAAQDISAAEFWSIKEVQSPIIIDVRTEQEFKQGHIEGAIHIPYQQIEIVTKVVKNTELPIVLYCRSGRRAGVAQQILEQQGYSYLYNAGGLDALLNAKPH